MKKLLSNNWVEGGFLLVLLVGASLSFFKPEIPLVQQTTQYAVLIMFGFLFLGLFFLVFDQIKLVFVSLSVCAAMCLFLKSASNARLVLPTYNQESSISIAHINLSNINSILDLQHIIDRNNPDVLSLQELTPDWNQELRSHLNTSYPFVNSQVRIDPYGMAIYSKLAMTQSDTFNYKKVPNLACSIKNGNSTINLISSYLLSLNKSAESNTKEHFSTISDKVAAINNQTIVLGDFNMVYWQSEILEFRTTSNLENSRRDFGEILSRQPSDHMFYTKDLECTQFTDLQDSIGSHVGILGIYQLKTAPQLKEEDIIVPG